MPGTVGYERDGHVATITYNRPDVLNAINGELREDLNAAWLRFREDEEAWVAIVTGAGRAFCAGADLKDGAGSVGTWPGSFWEIPTVNSFESGLEIWKPTIAAVNGYCLGYGLTLVSACDFVLASERRGVRVPRGAHRCPDDRRCDAAAEARSACSTRSSCCSPAIASTRIAAKEIGLALDVVAARRPPARGPASRRPVVPRCATRGARGEGDGVPRATVAVGRRGADG